MFFPSLTTVLSIAFGFFSSLGFFVNKIFANYKAQVLMSYRLDLLETDFKTLKEDIIRLEVKLDEKLERIESKIDGFILAHTKKND